MSHITIKYTKMHGTGNSFVLVSDLSGLLEKQVEQNLSRGSSVKNLEDLASLVCSQQFGIGADGFVLLSSPPRLKMDGTDPDSAKDYHFSLTHYNSDGTIAEICVNALRCSNLFAQSLGLGSYLKHSQSIDFLTGTGIVKTKQIKKGSNKVADKKGLVQVTVSQKQINGNHDNDAIKNNVTSGASIESGGRRYYPISMGNPHAVTHVDDFNFDYKQVGKDLQNDSKHFPFGVNVEFVKKKNDDQFEVRVIERGCGETFSCGSGALAVAKNIWEQKTSTHSKLKIEMLGGTLEIRQDGEREDGQRLELVGEAATISEGYFFI